jgi:hypothetical protein
LVVIVKLWARDFPLLAGENVVVLAFGSIALPWFNVVERDAFCEVYCEGAADTQVIQGDRELESGHYWQALGGEDRARSRRRT